MANAPANIIYPIQDETYPITDPGPGKLSSAYISASFSITCQGGPLVVQWGMDDDILGEAKCYDTLSVHQVWKLPGGQHLFWVRSDCGDDRVSFYVGS